MMDKEFQKLIDKGVELKAKPIIERYEAELRALGKRKDAVAQEEAELQKHKEEALREEERILAAEAEARRKADAEIRASEAEIRADETQKVLDAAESRAREIIAEAQDKVRQILAEADEKQKFLQDVDEKAKSLTEEAKAQADQVILDAEEKAKALVADAEAGVKAERERLEAAKIETLDARAEAIKEKNKALEERTLNQLEFLENIEKHNSSVEQRFNDQLTALTRMNEDLMASRLELEEKLEEADGDRKYLAELKERFKGCSKADVERLNADIHILSEDLEYKNLLLEERDREIIDLRRKLGDTGGRNLEEVVAGLTRELQEARDSIASMPGEDRIRQLENTEREYSAMKTEMAELKESKDRVESELSRIHSSQRKLESAQAEAKALDVLNAQLTAKLHFISETYKANRESKFAGLLEVDKKAAAARSRDPEPVSLPQLVSYVRAWGATREENPLYYSEETIRVFVASLAASYDASRLIILQGLSGTGKTSLPRLFAESLGITCDLVSVQPSWRDNRELLGYDNDFTNRFKETEFTKFVYAASRDQKRITVVILDEMNLARIEYYFADFLSELERRLDVDSDVWTVPLISNYTEEEEDKRPAHLAYISGSARLKIGKNVWFVGTANNDDSTSTITDKVYDRAQILDLDKRADSFAVDKPENKMSLTLPTLADMFARARSEDKNRLAQADWDKIHTLDNDNLMKMDITFGSRIKTQLEAFVPVYVACGGTKERAIDYYLAHKILRKLDEKFDSYIREQLIALEDQLGRLFGKKNFPETMRKIVALRRRNFGDAENGDRA